MTPGETSWAFSLGAIFVIAAAFAIQRYVTYRYIRNERREEVRREAAHQSRGKYMPERMDDAGLKPLTLPEWQAFDAIKAAAKAETDKWS